MGVYIIILLRKGRLVYILAFIREFMAASKSLFNL